MANALVAESAMSRSVCGLKKRWRGSRKRWRAFNLNWRPRSPHGRRVLAVRSRTAAIGMLRSAAVGTGVDVRSAGLVSTRPKLAADPTTTQTIAENKSCTLLAKRFIHKCTHRCAHVRNDVHALRVTVPVVNEHTCILKRWYQLMLIPGPVKPSKSRQNCRRA